MKPAAYLSPRRAAGGVDAVLDALAGLTPLRRGVLARAAIVTPLGWAIVVLGVASWIVGSRLGWEELELVAAACLVIGLLSAVFAFGRAELAIEVRLDPPRVVVGEPATGEVIVRNKATRRLLPLPVELPVGAGLARFDISSLAPGEQYREAFIVPTNRRAVIDIGPATSVRGDPLGAVRREVTFGGVTELFVHPRTALLEGLGSGFLRDLEGNTTEAISPSDLAFHSLRSYVAGDDRRHIHWRTSARMASGDLMVRQFLDTRRSHLVIVLDSGAASYQSEEEFELAVSAGASLALRAVRDEQEASVLAGPVAVRAESVRVLDAFSRAALTEDPEPLARLAARAVQMFSDASIAVVVSGSRAVPAEIRGAAGFFDYDTRVIGLVADLDATSGVRGSSGLSVITVSALPDLSRLVLGVMRS